MRRFLVFLLLALVLLGAACQPGPTDPTPGPTDLRLLVLPDDGPAAVIALIDGAQESIRFKIYLLTSDEIIAALAAAANRGVEVRVLIEQNPVGGGESNQQSADRLKEAGVSVRWAPSLYQLTHEKSLLVDDRQALVSTFNYTKSSFANNREYGLLTADPALVSEIAAIFDADWTGKPYERVRNPALVVSPLNSRPQIEALIDGAQKSLWLEENTLLDDDIAGRLAAAAQRGVEVRFLGPLRTDEEDLAEPNYRRLQAAGAQVSRLAAPYVHAKVIVADGKRALVGSINLSAASLNKNRELGLVTEDAAIIARLQKTFEGDWQLARQVRAAPTGVIGWQEAGNYLGAEVTVEGEIMRTHDTGKVTFLNFTPNYRGTLTLVIFASDYDRYPAAPVDYFLNKHLRAKGMVKDYQGAPEIIIDSPDQIEILLAAAAQPVSTQPAAADAPTSLAATSAPLPPTPAAAAAIVAWRDADDHMGQEITVEGKVVRTHDTGKVTFLNFTDEWRGTLSIVIFASDYDKFPQPPSQLFRDQTVRVSGQVKEYQGAPEIVVESADAIEIIAAGPGDDATSAGEAAPTASLAATAPPPTGVIPWQQAGDYRGQTITISGRIVRASDIGSITFLNFSQERGDFVAVIFQDDYANFSSPPAELYQGQSVWVTGQVTEHDGVPQIVVRSPAQIEIFP
ncbi:MAG: hypothetical protein K1X65_23295 [Caldilineales bacterium]|nr:hypothetical protein [Caldilineales bacterium]